MSDVVARLYAALEGRHRVDRELAKRSWTRAHG